MIIVSENLTSFPKSSTNNLLILGTIFSTKVLLAPSKFEVTIFLSHTFILYFFLKRFLIRKIAGLSLKSSTLSLKLIPTIPIFLFPVDLTNLTATCTWLLLLSLIDCKTAVFRCKRRDS